MLFSCETEFQDPRLFCLIVAVVVKLSASDSIKGRKIRAVGDATNPKNHY